jgi:hypothetical protein
VACNATLSAKLTFQFVVTRKFIAANDTVLVL